MLDTTIYDIWTFVSFVAAVVGIIAVFTASRCGKHESVVLVVGAILVVVAFCSFIVGVICYDDYVQMEAVTDYVNNDVSKIDYYTSESYRSYIDDLHAEIYDGRYAIPFSVSD